MLYALAAKQVYQKAYYDRNSKPVHFKVGQKVHLKELKPQTGKFYFRWDGSYEITKVIPPKNFVIRHALTSHEFVVNSDRLKNFETRQNTLENQLHIPLESALETSNTEPKQSKKQLQKSYLPRSEIQSEIQSENEITETPPLSPGNSQHVSDDPSTLVLQSTPSNNPLIAKRARGRPRKSQSVAKQISNAAPRNAIPLTRQLRKRINLPAKLSHPDILLKH